MIDHTDDGLRASIKALDEVIGPAIDKNNPLAVEQVRLVSRFLGFLRSRIPYEHARTVHELHNYLSLAKKLINLAPNDAPADVKNLLAKAIEAGVQLAESEFASASQLHETTKILSAAVSTLVRSVALSPPEIRAPIETAVVRASQSLLDVQRAWFLPMGFEPDPSRVPHLNDLLEAPLQVISRSVSTSTQGK